MTRCREPIKCQSEFLSPTFVKFVEVTGLKRAVRCIVNLQETVATVRIPEIEQLSTRRISSRKTYLYS